jgi:plastocyanin
MTATSRRRRSAGLVLVLAALACLLPGTSHAQAGRQVVGAFFLSYVPDVHGIRQGDTLTFVNIDPFGVRGHSFTHATGPGVTPRFDSDIARPGEAVEVRGVDQLVPGEYGVRCRVHPNMTGGLIVGRTDGPNPVERLLKQLGPR